MIIYINGRGMNAPELKAYISELEAENVELRAKVESDNRQIAEYKRLLKAAVEDFRILGTMLEDGHGHCTAEIGCHECVLGGGNLADDCQWRHEAESLALIGEEGDTNG